MRAVVLTGALIVATAAPSVADNGYIEIEHEGILFVGLQPLAGKKFDIAILEPREGLNRVLAAFDVLYGRSPLSAKRIDILRSNGPIEIYYDPNFPESKFASLTVAAFFPDYYDDDADSKLFRAVVGRYGAKWPTKELAAVLAHELVGHGMQHHRGKVKRLRTVDLECEAYLYEENAYQNLGFDKHSLRMIKFRKSLENKWCETFRAYMRRNMPRRMAL